MHLRILTKLPRFSGLRGPGLSSSPMFQSCLTMMIMLWFLLRRIWQNLRLILGGARRLNSYWSLWSNSAVWRMRLFATLLSSPFRLYFKMQILRSLKLNWLEWWSDFLTKNGRLVKFQRFTWYLCSFLECLLMESRSWWRSITWR